MSNNEIENMTNESTQALSRSIGLSTQAVFYHLIGAHIKDVVIDGVYGGRIRVKAKIPNYQTLEGVTQTTFEFGLVCLSGRIAEMHNLNRMIQVNEWFEDSTNNVEEYHQFWEDHLNEIGVGDELIYRFMEANEIVGDDRFNLDFFRSIHDRAFKIITLPKIQFVIEHIAFFLEIKEQANGDEIHKFLKDYLADININLKS